MTVKRKARIGWLKSEEGGRPTPPRGPDYSTVARFQRLADLWPQEAWSIVLEISSPADPDGIMVADIRLLAAEAPIDLLARGSRFDLFEGGQHVASGEVL